jgi:hypothetical protein
MNGSNPDCPPFAIQGWDPAQTPTGFLEIFGDDFPVLPAMGFCRFCSLDAATLFPDDVPFLYRTAVSTTFRVTSGRILRTTSVNGQKWVLNYEKSRKAKQRKEIKKMKQNSKVPKSAKTRLSDLRPKKDARGGLGFMSQRKETPTPPPEPSPQGLLATSR